jgi:hypothetical protein
VAEYSAMQWQGLGLGVARRGGDPDGYEYQGTQDQGRDFGFGAEFIVETVVLVYGDHWSVFDVGQWADERFRIAIL